MNDFQIADHGTIISIRPLNDAAGHWLDENVRALAVGPGRTLRRNPLRPRSHHRNRRGRFHGNPLIGAAPYAAMRGVGLRRRSTLAPEGDLGWASSSSPDLCCCTCSAVSLVGLDAFLFSWSSACSSQDAEREPRQLIRWRGSLRFNVTQPRIHAECLFLARIAGAHRQTTKDVVAPFPVIR
jgi:hypothetical protein